MAVFWSSYSPRDRPQNTTTSDCQTVMVELNICGVINKHMTLTVYSSSCIIISYMQSRTGLQISLSTSQDAAHATTAAISGDLGAAMQTQWELCGQCSHY